MYGLPVTGSGRVHAAWLIGNMGSRRVLRVDAEGDADRAPALPAPDRPLRKLAADALRKEAADALPGGRPYSVRADGGLKAHTSEWLMS